MFLASGYSSYMDFSDNLLEIESNHLLHSNLLFHGEISSFERVLVCNRGPHRLFDLYVLPSHFETHLSQLFLMKKVNNLTFNIGLDSALTSVFVFVQVQRERLITLSGCVSITFVF